MATKSDKISKRWIRETRDDFRTFLDETNFPDPREVVKTASKAFDCDPRHILNKGLKRNSVRDAAIYLERGLTGKSNVNLGDYFSGISGAAITMCYNHVAQQLISTI